MKLIGYELHKLFQKKILLLVWLGMAAALLFVFYWQCTEDDIYDQTLYTQLSAQYGGMDPDTALAELEQFSSALSLLQTDIILRETGMEEEILQMILEEQASAFGMTYQEVKDRYAVYAQDREGLNQILVVLVSLREQYQYADNYTEFLEEMPDRAEKLQTASVFVRPDSFSYRHILKSVQDYGSLGEVDIIVDYNQGILTLARDKTPALFLLVILLFFAGSTYQEEADSGMLGLLTAIRSYDPERDASFRTYAEICIKSRLLTAVRAAQGGKHAPLNHSISYEPPLFDGTSAHLFSSTESPEDVVIGREELKERLDALKGQLSELEAQILTPYLSGLSCGEIARRVGRSRKSVDNAIQRIRRKMARSFSSGVSSES